MYDCRALDTYFAIARELKDAYPADYNDLGKIWDIISRVGKKVLPVLKVMPGPIAQGIATTAGGAIGLGDAVRAKRVAKKQRQKARKQRVLTAGKTSNPAESRKE
jgi:hypothetical protein